VSIGNLQQPIFFSFFLTFYPLFSTHFLLFFPPYFLRISDWHRKKKFLGIYMTCVSEWTSLPISSYVCNNFWPLMKSFLVDLISSWQGKSSYIVRIYNNLFPFSFPSFFLFLFTYEPNWYFISFSLFSSLIRTWLIPFLFFSNFILSFFSNFILSSSFIFSSLYFLPLSLIGLVEPFSLSLSLSLSIFLLLLSPFFTPGWAYLSCLINFPIQFLKLCEVLKTLIFTCRGILIRKWEVWECESKSSNVNYPLYARVKEDNELFRRVILRGVSMLVSKSNKGSS
jgi:hypothetical protein